MRIVLTYIIDEQQIDELQRLWSKRSSTPESDWRHKVTESLTTVSKLLEFTPDEISLTWAQNHPIRIVDQAPELNVGCGRLRKDTRLTNDLVADYSATVYFSTPPGEQRPLGPYGINGASFLRDRSDLGAALETAYATGLLFWVNEEGGQYRFDAESITLEALSNLIIGVVFGTLNRDEKWLERRSSEELQTEA